LRGGCKNEQGGKLFTFKKGLCTFIWDSSPSGYTNLFKKKMKQVRKTISKKGGTEG